MSASFSARTKKEGLADRHSPIQFLSMNQRIHKKILIWCLISLTDADKKMIFYPIRTALVRAIIAGVTARTPAWTGFPTIYHMKLDMLLTLLCQDKLF